MVCFALFRRWEWILLGQRQAAVSHHDRIPAQHWAPHAVGAVQPWERTPAQPSPAEPPAHQQYVLGSCWEKRVPGALLGAGLAFLPSLGEGGDDGTHVSDRRVRPSTASCACVSRPPSAISPSPSGCSLLESSVTHHWLWDCQSLIVISMCGLKRKIIIKLLKILAVWENSLPDGNADPPNKIQEQGINARFPIKRSCTKPSYPKQLE